MQFIKPMLAKQGKLPTDDNQYGFEIKWDGMRCILYHINNEILLRSRNQKDITSQYPELQELGTKLNGQQVILDGEIIALDTRGRPSFSLLQHRMGLSSSIVITKKRQEIPVTYISFDILYLNNKYLMDLPYTERRHILDNLGFSSTNLQVPAYQLGHGKEIQKAVSDLGLEGIIAKRLISHYLPGKRSDDWLKIKNNHRQEFVIGGWLPGKGQRSEGIGSLVLGYYDMTLKQAEAENKEPQFLYAGKVGTGFTKDLLQKLLAMLTPLKRDSSPFSTDIPPKDTIFVEPQIIGEFEFTEWTPNNTLRHPSFKGLRYDKAAPFVIKES